MKFKELTVAATVAAVSVTLVLTACAEAKGKPYPLKTCIVSDEKLGGDMGPPYVFVHQGQEVKLCCKSCLKDFNKESAKYLKKINDASAAPTK